jgi:hypothetical protein
MRMKTNLFVIISLIAITILGALYVFQTRTASAPADGVIEEMAMPSRPPYPDCSWERLMGTQFSLWGQRCPEVGVYISESLPGVFLERRTASGTVAESMLVRVFDLPAGNGNIADILPTLEQESTWDTKEACTFTVDTTSPTPGVARYILRPSGSALAAYQQLAATQPVLSTCGGYGLGNSGVHYFEIRLSHPTKVLFINAGQEEPLFDVASFQLI